MTIHYLDVDDEVTTAVARLRTAGEPHVALVLPAGSRIATSRINFRLLAREAAARDRHLAIVAPETAVRAIAIAAGLPAYGTVASYEEALADELAQEARERNIPGGPPPSVRSGAFRRGAEPGPAMEPDASAAAGAPEPAPRPAGQPTAPGAQAPAEGLPRIAGTGIAETGAAGGLIGRGDADRRAGQGEVDRADRGPRTGARSAGALPVAGPVREPPGPRGRRRALVALLVLVVLLVVGGAGAYLVLPSATIVVTPLTVAAGPVSLQVRADPSATAVDAANLVIPAQQVPVPLSVDGTFPASGQKVSQTPASGSVTFTSNDTIDPVTIPAGTTLGTPGGVQFLTQATVVTPRATVLGTTINPGQASAPVQAVTPGTSGNVPAHAISVVPTRLQAFQVSVDNPAATSGGTRTVTKVVSQQDYDAAVKQLDTQLAAQLTSSLASPSLPPAGTTLVPATATLGTSSAAPAASALVGTAVSSFQLTATAAGSVLALSTQPLSGLASSYLEKGIPAGWSLFPDSIRTTESDPVVQNGRVMVTVTARGERWHPLDAASLLAQVKGRSVADARSILAQYGQVSIATWPSFVTSIPTLDARVTLTVAPPRPSGS